MFEINQDVLVEKFNKDSSLHFANPHVDFIINTMGRKYAFYILLGLKKHGTLRNKDLFNLLKGISPSSLSRFLRQLEKQQLITRTVYSKIPPTRVDYSLSHHGEKFLSYLMPMLDWVRKIIMCCADCNCTPEDCKNSKSSKDCSDCKYDQCCCWEYFHKK